MSGSTLYRSLLGPAKKLLVLVTISASLLLSAPTFAADWNASSPNLSLSLSIPDVYFDGPETASVPITVTYAKLGAQAKLVSGSIHVNANQAGVSNGISASIWINSTWALSGTWVGAYLNVYPSSIDLRRGPLFISGDVVSYVSAGSQETQVALSLMPIQIVPNATKLSKPRAKLVRQWESHFEITGIATAQTITKGVVPAGGVLTLQIKKPGRTQWISSLTGSVDSFGEYSFSLSPASKFPKGTQFRVALGRCGWCANAMSAQGKI